MAEAKVKIRIGSEAQLSGFDKLKNALATAGSKVKTWAKGIGSNLMNIKAGFDMLKGAISSIGSIFKKAFDFETMTTQFKTLLGDIDTAKAHMQMLKELGDTPPFSLEQFAEASRAMMVFSDGVLGMKQSLELVGDAAAATGKPVEQVGEAVGKAYAMIRDGQPISRVTSQLRNLGLITPDAAANLVDLQKAGASNVEIWQTLTKELKKFKGAMAETEKTGNGLIGSISSQWDNIVRGFGEAFGEQAKGGMQTLLNKMKEIQQDGTLAAWANKIAEAISEALEALKALHKELKSVGDEEPVDVFDRSRGKSENIAQFFGNAWAGLGASAAWGRGLVMPGESARENYHAYAALHGYGPWSDANARALSKWKNERGDWDGDIDIRAVEEQRILDIKKEAVEAAKEQKKIEEQQAAAETKKVENALAAAEVEKKAKKRIADEKKAAEKEHQDGMKLLKKEAEFRRQLAEEDAKAEEERQKKLKEEADQRIKFETQLHDVKMQAIEDEIKEEEKAKKAFDDKIKRGIEGEKSRRFDGQSRVKLDPDTGLPQSVADMQRAERFAKNGTKEQGKAARRAAADEKRASKLEEQLARGGKISKGDQKFLDALKELNKRREADKRMKELNEQKDKAVLEMKKTVDDIKLGLEQNLKIK